MIAGVFIATVVVVAAAVIAIVAVAARRSGRGVCMITVVAGALAVWLLATGLAGSAGALALTGAAPRVAVLAWLAVIAGVLTLRTASGRAFVEAAPRGAIIAIEAFRVVVELVLWRLFVAGVVPGELTFDGRNFDVLVGVTAVPVAIAAWGHGRRRWRLALTWHVASLLLLANIVVMAVLSAPGPQHVFDFRPSNTVIGQFPFVWLPTFLVPIAAIAHVVGIRQALSVQRHRGVAAKLVKA